MIAGEKKLVFIKQDHVATSMPRRRNNHELAVKSKIFFALNDTFDA